MVTLKRLEYFAKVVEAQSITRAADQLYIAQPALGMHIRELEAALGVDLLSRHARGVTPTKAGHLLLERSREIFALLDRTREDLLIVDGAIPLRFRLGITSSTMMLISADLLLTISKSHPDVALQLQESPSFLLIDALERQDIDVALAYSVTPRPGLSVTPVLKENLMLVVRADQAPSQDPVDMNEVFSLDLVLGHERDVGRKLVEASAFAKGRKLRIRYETHSVTCQRDLVLRGVAAAILPLGAIVHELERGEVSARQISDPDMCMTLSIVHRQATDTANHQYFSKVEPILQSCVKRIATRLGTLASVV